MSPPATRAAPSGPAPHGPDPYGPDPYGPDPYGPVPYGPVPYGAVAPRPIRALAGTAAVVLAVAASKWGSYLGLPPVYPLDVLLGLAVLGALLAHRPAAATTTSAGRRTPGLIATAYLGYVLLRFVLGQQHGLTALRDFAPYGYLLAAFLAAAAYHRSSAAQRARTARLLYAALLAHLAWTALATAAPGLVRRLPVLDPSQDLHVLSVRGATDATVVGITAALYLVRFFQQGRGRQLAIALLSLAVVLGTPARAALVATAVALAIALLVCFGVDLPGAAGRPRKMLLAAVLPALLLAAGALVPQTTAGSKLLAGFGLATAHSDVDEGGILTVRGRLLAWHRVVDYIAVTHSQQIGVGFGPDFLGDAGARAPLGGFDLLRSPHNYLVGTYARLGGIGLLLLLALLAAVVREMLRCRRLLGAEPLVLFAVIYPVAFAVCGMFGVELESPFAAIPFYWCLGVVLCRPCAARTDPVGPAPVAQGSV
jgi:O-antigen ligase